MASSTDIPPPVSAGTNDNAEKDVEKAQKDVEKPQKDVEKPLRVKGAWGDAEEEDDSDSSSAVAATSTLDIQSLNLSDDGQQVDKPEIVLKSERLSEDVESENTPIRMVTAENTPYTSAKTFEDLNLSESLLRGLYSEMKFERPSRIQAITLPMILTPPYANLIAQAQNGSGKTTCFVLGMLSRVDSNLKEPQALCVCPTRELAVQNEQVLLRMGKYTGITSICAVPTDPSNYTSRKPSRIQDQVVIGTPGTIKKWMTSLKILGTRHIKILVFDEADHMLAEDGFQDDSLRIVRDIKKNSVDCQILLFSATFDERVKSFVTRTIPNPTNQVFVKKEELSLDVIKQYRVKCPNNEAKISVLKDRIFPIAERLGQSIIFVRTRATASELHQRLEADGHKCTSIQGGLSIQERDRVIQEFRSGETKILIATDVLARGFDQAQVTLVVNYDIPLKQNFEPDYELYLHRIGRSGRFGRKGAAFNFLVTNQDEKNLDKIQRHFNRFIPEVPWDNDEEFERVLRDAGLA